MEAQDRDQSGGPSRRGTRGRRFSGAGDRGSEPPITGAAAQDREPDPESVARSIALRMLTGAPRSRAQLEEAMAKKDVPEDVSVRVLDRFEEVGLVNDVEYAEMLVRTRRSERGLAKRVLAAELHAKGVDRDVAERALSVVQPEDEEKTARELLRHKARPSVGLERDKRRRRLVGMLARKGYSPSLALRLVDEVLGEEGGGTDEDPYLRG